MLWGVMARLQLRLLLLPLILRVHGDPEERRQVPLAAFSEKLPEPAQIAAADEMYRGLQLRQTELLFAAHPSGNSRTPPKPSDTKQAMKFGEGGHERAHMQRQKQHARE